MKVVITGGTGFLRLRLARRLLELPFLTLADDDTRTIDKIVLADAHLPSERPGWMDDRVELIGMEVSDPDSVLALIDRDDVSVFHLERLGTCRSRRRNGQHKVGPSGEFPITTNLVNGCGATKSFGCRG